MRGQPDTPTADFIVEAVKRALAEGRTRYPDNHGEPRLRTAIAEKLRRDNGLSYDPATEILVTDGATCGIYAALGALLQPGNEVCCPIRFTMPTLRPFSLGRPAGQRNRPSTRAALPLTGRRWKAHTPRTRLLLLNTPWNPVGSVLSQRVGGNGVCRGP